MDGVPIVSLRNHIDVICHTRTSLSYEHENNAQVATLPISI